MSWSWIYNGTFTLTIYPDKKEGLPGESNRDSNTTNKKSQADVKRELRQSFDEMKKILDNIQKQFEQKEREKEISKEPKLKPVPL